MNRNRHLNRSRNGKANAHRRKLRGTGAKPRLSVFRSSRHIYCQAIDDESGVTLAASCCKKVGDDQILPLEGDGVVDSAKRRRAAAVGRTVAAALLDKGISAVVFDRGWYRYHGRVKALADGARAAGLKF